MHRAFTGPPEFSRLRQQEAADVKVDRHRLAEVDETFAAARE